MTSTLPVNDPAEDASVLEQLDLSNGFAEPALVGLAKCATLVADFPKARISLIDARDQWVKASVGFDVDSPGSGAFLCRQALRNKTPLLVADVARDSRYGKEMLSSCSTHVRAYAGFPIALGGTPVGVLCVMDAQPRHLRPEQIDALVSLAFGIECWLARRRGRLQSRRNDGRLSDYLALSRQQMWECDDQLAVTWCSPVHSEVMARAESTMHQLIRSDAKLLDPDGRPLPTGDTLTTLLLRRQLFWRCVVRCEAGDTVRFMEVSGVSLWSATGRFLGHRGILADRTDWIRTCRTRNADTAPSRPMPSTLSVPAAAAGEAPVTSRLSG